MWLLKVAASKVYGRYTDMLRCIGAFDENVASESRETLEYKKIAPPTVNVKEKIVQPVEVYKENEAPQTACQDLTEKSDGRDPWFGVFDEHIGIYHMYYNMKNEREGCKLMRRRLLVRSGGSESAIESNHGKCNTGYWWKQLLSGGASALVSRTATAPIDRLKVMLQVNSGSGTGSMTTVIKTMLAEGGVKSLWRGNLVNCVKVFPESSIKFFTFEAIKSQMKSSENEQLPIGKRFIAGASGGIIAESCIYPMELLKTKLAIAKTNQYEGIYDCVKKVVKADGFRGLYKGLTPALLGIVPYAGIDLCIYETMKNNWIRSYPGEERREPDSVVLCFCGVTSSAIAQSASYPLGLVRTKLQAQSNVGKSGESPMGMIKMFKSIIQQNGFRGLYRGIIPTYLKVLPSVAITYVIYERMRKELGMHIQY